MHSAILFLTAFVTPFVAANLHSDAVCYGRRGGVSIYNAAATEAMCSAYRARNTGGNQWDQCPDCEMRTVGGLSVCHSDGWHMGGDQIYNYCVRDQGAGGSLAN